jgi:hypothetical protein
VKAKKPNDAAVKNNNEQVSHRIRLPGFLIENEIGLGDFIKQATSSIGVRPCAGCEKRAAALNRWTFSR